MTDRLAALRLFVRVAGRGSFSAGGRDLQVPQPTVSRTIAKLEAELGAPLFVRTTRALKLTEAGEAFLERVEPILASLEEAEQSLRGAGELRGRLRVGVSSTLAARELVPRLPGFLAKHPGLRVELLIDDARQALVRDGVDVALRFGALDDAATTTALRVRSWARALFASPAYLARAGTPTSPEDLSRHALVGAPSSRGGIWTFEREGEKTQVRVDARVTATVNEVSIALVVAGLGIAAMTQAACQRERETGAVVQVLPGWSLGELDLFVVFPAGRKTKASARAFGEFVVRELGQRERPSPRLRSRRRAPARRGAAPLRGQSAT